MHRKERAEVEWTIRTAVEALGFETLRLTVSSSKHVVLTVDKDGAPVVMRDVEDLNHEVRTALREAGHDPDGFSVEVESPGPRRPLLTLRHFERLQGERARIRAREPLPDGQVVVVGILAGTDSGSVLIRTGKGAPLRIPFEVIAEANLHP